MANPQFTLNRNHVLVTLDGISYQFKKGEPTMIQKRHVGLALGIGAEAHGAEAKEDAKEAEAIAERERADNVDRLDKVIAAVRILADRQADGDFTAGGEPKLKRVTAIVGEPVSLEEVKVAFEQVKREMTA